MGNVLTGVKIGKLSDSELDNIAKESYRQISVPKKPTHFICDHIGCKKHAIWQLEWQECDGFQFAVCCDEHFPTGEGIVKCFSSIKKIK